MATKLMTLASRSGLWQTIGASYLRRYLRTGDQTDLAEAIAMFRATAVTTEGGGYRRVRLVGLSNLGQALLAEYQRASGADFADGADALREALAVSRAAVDLVGPRRRGNRALALSNLAMVLRAETERTDDMDVACEAVDVSRAATEAVGRRHPNRALLLSNLATAQFDLFERTGDLEMLRQAVAACRAAVSATRLRRGRRAGFLSNLGIALQELWEYTGDLDVLREAVTVSLAAVAATGRGHTQRPVRLSNLGLTQASLSLRTGDLDLLRAAVSTQRAAIAAVPEGSREAVTWSNLGNMLRELYQSTGDQDTLLEAVAAGRAAVAAVPDGDSRHAPFQSNLGISLEALFDRTGELDALREAVAVGRAAVALTPAGHPDRARRLTNVGSALHSLFDATGEPEALAGAVVTSSAAVDAIPAGHRWQGTCLSNLGTALRAQFEYAGDLEVLRRAVAVGREAVRVTPPDDPGGATRLFNLGLALRDLSEQTGDQQLLTEARAAFSRAAGSATAGVSVRIRAARAQARADALAGDHPAALSAMQAVVGLLPRLAPRELHRLDRRHQLGGDEAIGIGAQAAACALSAGQPELAAVLLEHARGLLMAETMGARTEQARLREHAPELADELIRLQDMFSALDTVGTDPGVTNLGDRRRAAAASWDALLGRIRALTGFAEFLTLPQIGQLQQQTGDGPIVIVTADIDRCDALVLTQDPARPVRLVPLPGITADAAFTESRQLIKALLTTMTSPSTDEVLAAQRDLHRILGWLWDAVAAPVLAELGYSGTPGAAQTWPRLWWCPVGVLAFLPLHAAGHHDDIAASAAAPRTVQDRVVSSYTATVRVLGYARQASRPAGPSEHPGDALIISMPQTPGAGDLPGVRDEVDLLADLMPGVRVLEGPAATRESVLAALPAYPVAHFACHAVSGVNTEPDSSRLVVSGDETSPLTVTAISRLHLPEAELAYLSSCGTANPALGDEAVHITSAFQLAGYRNVIGTLWPVQDQAASRIAGEFYRQLVQAGPYPRGADQSARALHHAIRDFRDDHVGVPAWWIAHIHTGG